VVFLNLPLYKASGSAAFLAAVLYFAAQGIFVSFADINFLAWNEIFCSLFALNLFYDPVSKIITLTAAIAAFSALATAKSRVSNDKSLFNFSNLILLSGAAINVVSMTRDIFTMYVFIEIIAVSAYIMIASGKTRRALAGGFKYIIASSIGSALMLFSMGVFFVFAGDTSFGSIAAAYESFSGNILMQAAVALFLCGLFVKGGLAPFGGWLLGAYSGAPAAVSVWLSGIIACACGIIALVRFAQFVIIPSGNAQTLLLIVGAVSIIVGALGALSASDFKKALNYSGISQTGYIVMVLGAGSQLALIAALFHFFNYGVFQSLLFVNSAAVEAQTGTVNINRLGGLSSRMPVTAATSAVGFLSLMGAPPFGGFFSKLLIILALWQSGNEFFAVTAVIGSILAAGYFLRLERKVFFGHIPKRLENIKEAGWYLLAPSILLALIALGSGIFFAFMLLKFFAPVV